MKKKTFDRPALEAQLSQIEQDRPIIPPLNLLAIIGILAILAMAFQSCHPVTICDDIRNPHHYAGYNRR